MFYSRPPQTQCVVPQLGRAGKVAGRTIYRPEAVTGSLMQFQMRSKERVLADLQNKLGQLPANHSDRPALIRMIEGLGAEQAQAGVRL